jgi:site-specific DNA-methyltransferase (adenine-specific)
MKPNRIVLADCLDALREIRSNSIDLVLTDPPNNISKDKTTIHHWSWGDKGEKLDRKWKRDFGEWDKFGSDKNFILFTMVWVKECFRVPSTEVLTFDLEKIR